MTFVYTTVVVGAVFGAILAVGIAVSRALGWSRAPSRDDWFDAPFLGVAIIVLVLENLVYVGVPLQRSARPFAVVVLAGILFLAWRGRLKGAWRACPATVFVAAALVYVVHGAGLWAAGVGAYLGRAWGDQINYVAIAQFLIDVPAGQAVTAAQPAQIMALRYATNRIGQSVLHGFMSVCVGIEPSAMFEPLIVLSPALVAIAIYVLGRRALLPRPLAMLLAVVSGCVPALASIHLESFFSQAVGLPGLYYVIVLLDRASEDGDWRTYVKAALVCASTAAISLEFLPLLLLAVLTFGVAAMPGVPNKRKHLLWTAAIMLAPFLLRATTGLKGAMADFGVPTLQGIYPWAFSLEGVERLWAGDLVGRAFAVDATWLQGVSIGLLVVGALGLVMQVLGEALAVRGGEQPRWAGLARALVMLGVASAPWTIVLRGADLPYQFYKLLLSTTPLVVLGCGYAAWLAPRRLSVAMRTGVALCVLAPIGLLGATATADMALASARGDLPSEDPRYVRQSAHKVLDPAFQAVSQILLAPSTPRDVYQCVVDSTHNPRHVSGWFSIFARQHRLWALTPGLNDTDLTVHAGPHYYDWMPGMTPTPLFVTTKRDGAIWVTPPQQFPAREIGAYRVVQPGSAAVVLACAPSLETYRESVGVAHLRDDRSDIQIFSTLRRAVTVYFHSELVEGRRVPLALTVEGVALPLAMDATGHYAGRLELRSGVTRLTLATTEPAGGRAVAGGLTLALRTSDARLASIANPNGLDFGLTRDFFWLGGGRTILTIYASERGVAAIDAVLGPGPSVTSTPARRLRIESDAGAPFDLVTRGGTVTLRIPVAAGWNQIALEPLDKPEVRLDQDRRPLILSAEILRVTLEPAITPVAPRQPGDYDRRRGASRSSRRSDAR